MIPVPYLAKYDVGINIFIDVQVRFPGHKITFNILSCLHSQTNLKIVLISIISENSLSFSIRLTQEGDFIII